MDALKEIPKTANRIESIDILRGIVMVIMALDHVRDFFHHDALNGNDPLNLNTTWPLLYFTRWITHFCAPVFVFLSGTSVFLYAQKGRTKKQVSFFLFTRGVWLMLAEIFIVNFLWEFNFGYFLMLQVIWTIGLSMVILSVLQFLPYKVLLVIGLMIVFAHNLLDGIRVEQPFIASFGWSVVHVLHPYQIPPHLTLVVAYPFLPWLGLMITGYCLGKLYSKGFKASHRRKFLLIAGISAIGFFIILRFTDVYGDMNKWLTHNTTIDTLFDFIDTTKYPPSLLYISMTIGPALIVLAVTENVSTRLSRIIMIYGKVPFFYYLLHVFVIHVFAILLNFATGRENVSIDFSRPPGMLADVGYPLWVVYLVWIVVIVVLYFPCKWYSRYKASHYQNKWLSYL